MENVSKWRMSEKMFHFFRGKKSASTGGSSARVGTLPRRRNDKCLPRCDESRIKKHESRITTESESKRREREPRDEKINSGFSAAFSCESTSAGRVPGLSSGHRHQSGKGSDSDKRFNLISLTVPAVTE